MRASGSDNDAEMLTLTKIRIRNLQVTQRRMERSMLGLTLRGKVRNEEFRSRICVEDVIVRIAKLKREVDKENKVETKNGQKNQRKTPNL